MRAPFGVSRVVLWNRTAEGDRHRNSAHGAVAFRAVTPPTTITNAVSMLLTVSAGWRERRAWRATDRANGLRPRYGRFSRSNIEEPDEQG